MIRLLVVDKARLMCDAIAAALRGQPDIVVAGLATSLAEALPQLRRCSLAVISSGLAEDGTRRLIRTASCMTPPVKVLVTGLSEDEVLPYIEAGVAGYILKEESVEDLVERVRAADLGIPILSPRVMLAMMARLTHLAHLAGNGVSGEDFMRLLAANHGPSPRLTPREREVLALLGQGLSNQGIAEKLAIETGTVKNHVHNILHKLRVTSRYQAALSVRGGMAQVPPGSDFISLVDLAYGSTA